MTTDNTTKWGERSLDLKSNIRATKKAVPLALTAQEKLRPHKQILHEPLNPSGYPVDAVRGQRTDSCACNQFKVAATSDNKMQRYESLSHVDKRHFPPSPDQRGETSNLKQGFNYRLQLQTQGALVFWGLVKVTLFFEWFNLL